MPSSAPSPVPPSEHDTLRYPRAERLPIVERLPESDPTYEVADPYR